METLLPPVNISGVRGGRIVRDERDPPPPPPDGNPDEDLLPIPPPGMDQVKDNADPYLVKKESQTEEGKTEGGEGSDCRKKIAIPSIRFRCP